MSQDSFAAALDAELFASEDGDGDEEQAADPGPGPHAAAAGGSGGAGGQEEGDGEDPFAALDAMERDAGPAATDPAAPAADAAPGAAPPGASACPHPGFMFGLCIRCGAPKPDDGGDGGAAAATGRPGPSSGGGGSAAAGAAQGPGGGAPCAPAAAGMRIKHLHARQTLEVSAEEAARITASAIPSLLASRRLVLVLDLDHTLLNSVRVGDVSSDEVPLLAEVMRRQQAAADAGAAAAGGGCQEQQPQRSEGKLGPDAASAGPFGAGEGAAAPAGDGAAAASGDQREADSPAAALPPTIGHWHPPLLYNLAHCRLWTKMRPGIREFLQGAARLYELHIYTMGDRSYAREVARLLDPGGRLFAGRIVSASDSTKAHEKGLDVLLASEAHVLILDDTEHVWAGHRRNLIQVERYHFFGSSIRSWQPTARGLLENGTDESPADGMLATCLRVLTDVHDDFFADAGAAAAGAGGAADSGADAAAASGASKRAPTKRRRLREGDGSGRSGSEGPVGSAPPPPLGGGGPPSAAAPGGQLPPLDPASLSGRDVRACLADVRARVLRGCCLCFSRCWPQYVTPFEQPLWVLAESLGADCSTQYSPGRTTHVVVAPDKGELPLTDKVQAARQDGAAVVHYDWLLASKFRWQRADEEAFSMPAYVKSGRAAAAKARGFSLRGGGGSGAADAERDARIALRAAGRAGA